MAIDQVALDPMEHFFRILLFHFFLHKPSWQVFWSPIEQEIAEFDFEKSAPNHTGN